MIYLYSCKAANLIFINNCCKLKYYVIGGKVLCTLLLKLLYRNMMKLHSICQTVVQGQAVESFLVVTRVLLSRGVLHVPCSACTETSVLCAEGNCMLFLSYEHSEINMEMIFLLKQE